MASRSWNRVELIGNLTRDPELRYTPNGAAVATFGVATNRSYVSEGERKEEVDFHEIVAWNKLAELCNQLLKKGSRIFVSGRLQYREWEAQDGQKRRKAEIVLEDMIQLTPKSSGPEESAPQEISSAPRDVTKAQKTEPEGVESAVEKTEKKEESAPQENISDEDLPF